MRKKEKSVGVSTKRGGWLVKQWVKRRKWTQPVHIPPWSGDKCPDTPTGHFWLPTWHGIEYTHANVCVTRKCMLHMFEMTCYVNVMLDSQTLQHSFGEIRKQNKRLNWQKILLFEKSANMCKLHCVLLRICNSPVSTYRHIIGDKSDTRSKVHVNIKTNGCYWTDIKTGSSHCGYLLSPTLRLGSESGLHTLSG